MNFWRQIQTHISNGKGVCLLVVIASRGSSPGRPGYKQFVTDDGVLHGSIGGGVMEQKLTELAKTKLLQGSNTPFIKEQIHKANIEKNKSGMICSGQQTIAFYFLNDSHLSLLSSVADKEDSNETGMLTMDETGIYFDDSSTHTGKWGANILNEQQWSYKELMNNRPAAFIVGGGHVSLSLSRVLNQLGFFVTVFDDRPQLNTVEENVYAHTKIIANYEEVHEYINDDMNSYVVIMTVGYRSDGLVLRNLLKKKIKYLGMLGSAEKIKKLYEELNTEGHSIEDLQSVHAPVGLNIYSHTPDEIAISIAAEIILVKNQN